MQIAFALKSSAKNDPLSILLFEERLYIKKSNETVDKYCSRLKRAKTNWALSAILIKQKRAF
jgi:hypothetical protein